MLVLMQESFLEEIDAKLAAMGYSDRSAFIRDAVYAEMARNGVTLPPALKTAPQRKGKGGRPRKNPDPAPKDDASKIVIMECKSQSKVAEGSEPAAMPPRKKTSYKRARKKAGG